MNLSLGKSGFGFDRPENLARFVGQGLVILTGARIAGEKTGDDRWYEKFVPAADKIFERHLHELKKEGST